MGSGSLGRLKKLLSNTMGRVVLRRKRVDIDVHGEWDSGEIKREEDKNGKWEFGEFKKSVISTDGESASGRKNPTTIALHGEWSSGKQKCLDLRVHGELDSGEINREGDKNGKWKFGEFKNP